MTYQTAPPTRRITGLHRRRWLAAPALLAVALVACTSTADDAAPLTTNTTTHPTTTQPVPAATRTPTEDSVQEVMSGPQEVAFQSSTMPDDQIGRQLAWFLEAVQHLPIPAADIDEHFAPSLLAALPADQLNAALTQSGDTTAVRFLGVVATTPNSIDAAIDPGTGAPHTVISLTLDDDGKIQNLLFKPIPLSSRACHRPAPHRVERAHRASTGRDRHRRRLRCRT